MDAITRVKNEDIYKFLESLRKLGINAYVLQWANNTNSDFLLSVKESTHSHVKFDIQVESMDGRTKRELDSIKFISNKKFREIHKSV
ncbi:MAG: hypothetical protein COB67_00570 [SAR324 cluster bacterium]|uniref:Uncharacterized protein n=1 Tax=SAR324 cluster bacterium TaxID=2024889 RepID=A0A2A4TBI7_9DELT|nr:MAG: hypothetical protein COB67_00570 [SAR324 cluster bacterium]